jgi:hypothetical protein
MPQTLPDRCEGMPRLYQKCQWNIRRPVKAVLATSNASKEAVTWRVETSGRCMPSAKRRMPALPQTKMLWRHVTPSTPLSCRSTSRELFFLSESDGHPSLTTATLHTRQYVSISKLPSGEPVDIPILKKTSSSCAIHTHTFRLFLRPALLRAAKPITHRDPA